MAGNIDSFVIDASFILANLLPDEQSQEADEIIRSYRNGEVYLISSAIFNLEVLNGLKSQQLRRRITKEKCFELAKTFLEIGISCEDVDDYETFIISQKLGLTVYDASYVWLAKSKDIPLLSLDRRMKKLAI